MDSVTKCKQKYEGLVLSSKQDGDFKIIEYAHNKHVVVRFLETGYETVGRIGNVLNGQVKDRAKPSVYGVGIVGDSAIVVEGTKSKEYSVWVRMLDRCYSLKESSPTYEGCEVSDFFKFFPNFVSWCHNQIGFNQDGFALDKDILVKGNKLYSETTCCFVPREINNLFTNRKTSSVGVIIGTFKHGDRFGARFSKATRTTHLGYFNTEIEAFCAYKKAKEAHIKEVANRWMGKIDHRVYDALMNWTIEIDD